MAHARYARWYNAFGPRGFGIYGGENDSGDQTAADSDCATNPGPGCPSFSSWDPVACRCRANPGTGLPGSEGWEGESPEETWAFPPADPYGRPRYQRYTPRLPRRPRVEKWRPRRKKTSAARRAKLARVARASRYQAARRSTARQAWKSLGYGYHPTMLPVTPGGTEQQVYLRALANSIDW